MTITQMDVHITELAQKHGICIKLRTTYRGRAVAASNQLPAYTAEDLPGYAPATIHIPSVRSSTTYALALHELGHLLGHKPSTRLDKEAAAWEWAIHTALAWTPAMESKMRRCLMSYKRWAAKHRGVVKDSSKMDVLLAGSRLP